MDNELIDRGRGWQPSAEALASIAIQRPAFDPVDDCGLAIGAYEEPGRTPAILLPHGNIWFNRPVQGFVKYVTPAEAGKALLLGNLATLCGGMPSAAYIAVKGSNVERLTLFSAQAFATFEDDSIYDEQGRLVDLHEMTEPKSDSVSLAKAGQWRAFINDWDGYGHNTVRDVQTRSLCMFDHEDARSDVKPAAEGPDYNLQLIRHGWETRNSTQARSVYWGGAMQAAQHIATLSEQTVRQQADLLRAHDLSVEEEFVDCLLTRRALFADGPLIVKYLAARAGLNTNPGWGKKRDATLVP